VAALVAVALLSLRTAVFAQEDERDDDTTKRTGQLKDLGTRQAAAEINAASDQATQALKRMQLPAGLVAKLWAAEPMLANPVAIAFDEHGRLFVSETYRYRTSTLDIRDYMWTLESELATRTNEEWLANIKRNFGDAGLKELSIESERLRLLEDTKHTGIADKSTVYAEGFNTPLDGIASGVLTRRGEVWFTNIPNLWKFTGADQAETRTVLSHGYGVRFNFTGHDLHGLTFGPDGKIYFSIGDRGAHATATDGSVADTPDSGGVFRCNPDGTQLELFATGLRNPQDLLFTENGDLFTGDNDCDQGDEERLVHVVEGGDSGWRIGYQFPPLEKNSPWLREKMWTPRHEGQAAFMLAPICNIEDGPSGIAYYPGTGLNESYRGNIFITHFKGSIAKSGIYTYTVKPDGANYAIATAKPFLQNSLPTDVKFGPDGRLYYSDWAEGWPKSKRGRIYAISDPLHENDPIVRETEKIIGSDFTKKSNDELAALLAHPDWRVRLEAQYTLAERGEKSLSTLTAVASKTDANPLARRHAIWGLGQLATANRKAALDPLRALVHDADAEVRAQAIKVLGDQKAVDQFDVFIVALKDESNRVKFFAGQSLGKIGRGHDPIPRAVPALLEALRANSDRDEYLRHALVMGLVGNAQTSHQMTDSKGTPVFGLVEGDEPKEITAAIHDSSRSVRLGVLLALRRIGLGKFTNTSATRIQDFLTDSDAMIVREAAVAINDAPINDALPALATLVTKPITDDVVMLRVINANFRLGQPANAAAIAAYAARADTPALLRAEAVAQLALWPKPPQRDRLVGIYRPLPDKTRDATVAVNALTPILPSLLDPQAPEEVQTAAIAAVQSLKLTGAADALFALVTAESAGNTPRAAALRALDTAKDPRLPEVVKLASASKSQTLRAAALPIAARLSPADAVTVLSSVLANGSVEEQKTALKTLGTLADPAADRIFVEQLTKLAAGQVRPALQLELITAAATRSDATVKKLLAERDAAIKADPDPLAPFRVALQGGNRQRGERIFNTQPVMACVRCHRVGSESGGEAGPNLAGVGSKYPREYLLESVIKPNAKIAPGFDTVVATLKSGGVAAGTVASETAEMLNLRDTDNNLHEIKKSDIAKREGAPSAMPEIFGMILSKSELRDVIEYLASLRERPDRPIDDSIPRALRGIAAK
jgi:quinoprotein glucose dehydrogenase